jgi:uncharacterized membrane protein YbhN (UPF0104 family)
MMRRKGVLWAVLIGVLAVIVFVYRDRIHFDWKNFGEQLRHIQGVHAVAGIALVYMTYWLRAVRWSVMVEPTKKVHRVYSGGAVWAAGGFDATVSCCAKDCTSAELTDCGLHAGADV